MKPMSITELVTTAHGTAKEKGWWQDPRSPGECIALMHSELSEALEEVRKPISPISENWYREDGKPEGVPSELADTVIRIADFCGFHGIDLEKAIIEKMRYNESREYRHGGKVL